MRVQWLGHAAFLVTTEKGCRILMDPYESGAYGGGIGYGPIRQEVDIVTVSHTQHADHNHTDGLSGDPVIIADGEKRSIRGVAVRGVDAFHDQSGGRERGKNRITCVEADGILLVHLGDLGHVLTKAQTVSVGRPDVLLIPVGGTFTVDANEATEIVNQLNPRLVVPMHFKTSKCSLPIEGVEAFLLGKAKVKRGVGSVLEVDRGKLPDVTEIVLLDHSL